jgi:hypothetical protein
MVKSIIIIGSTDLKTSEYYKQLGIAPSMLITTCDHEQLIGHTSVGDVPDLKDLEYILSQAKEVYWAESSIDEFFDADSYYDFLNWLKDYNLVYKNVVNFYKIKFDDYNWNQLLPQNLNQNHAVFFGCSHTAGVGLPDVETHYATQVAKHFGKQVCNLASGAGSNGLIFDRFTQFDFFPEQIVVVQLTYLERLHYCGIDRNLRKILFTHTSDNLRRSLIDVYHKDFLFYELLQKIRAMIAIARDKKLKMVFWLAEYKNSDIYSKADQRYFYHMPEFVPASLMENYCMDVANDRLHPGIESNKFIADVLVKYIKTVYNKD